MKEFLAKVYITLKPGVNDPQGLTVRNGLRMLGFEGVEGVRMGKYLEIRLRDESLARAGEQVAEMCRKLLANPVIEEFRFDVEELNR